MAGLRGFASHGGSILSRGWLATVEAPGYPRHPPSKELRFQACLNLYINIINYAEPIPLIKPFVFQPFCCRLWFVKVLCC